MVYRDLLTAREDMAFVSEPLWKTPELNPEPLWVVTSSMHATYWHGPWHDSCWEKQSIASGIKYLMYFISGSVREEHQIQLEHRSGTQAWAFTGGAAASLLPADVLGWLRTTQLPKSSVWNVVARKDHQGSLAHGDMGQMPIVEHTSGLHFCAAVRFFA